MATLHVIGSRGGCPFKIVARRQRNVALTPVVDVLDSAIDPQLPAKHPYIVQLLTNLERGQKLVLGNTQLQQLRIFVVRIQLFEIRRKTRVLQKTACQWKLIELAVGAVWRKSI